MENDDITLPSGEANPTDGATKPLDEGNKNPEPQGKANEGKTFSQKDLDDNAANTRRATERETKKKLLAQLGLTLEDENKLNAFKEAYEATLSEEEKRDAKLAELESDNQRLTLVVEEKDYIIKALIELTGKKEEDVEKIVKMAKGLKTEETTIEEAIKEVMGMIKTEPTTPATQVVTTPAQNPDMPVGQQIQQPSIVTVDVQDNPFKKGPSFNLTRQGQLLRTNPELARKLAAEAGVKLPN